MAAWSSGNWFAWVGDEWDYQDAGPQDGVSFEISSDLDKLLDLDIKNDGPSMAMVNKLREQITQTRSTMSTYRRPSRNR